MPLSPWRKHKCWHHGRGHWVHNNEPWCDVLGCGDPLCDGLWDVTTDVRDDWGVGMGAAELAKEVNKLLGSDAVRMGNDASLNVTYLPTGVLPVDVLLEGGIPRGRITEMYGDFSSLKSYVGLRCIAETQKDGGVCVLVDTEHAYDPDWAASLGVKVDELLVQRPATGEEAVDLTAALLLNGSVDLIVWDSVAATLPKVEHGKSATEAVQPARLAAFMSQSLRKITAANTGRTALLFINQTRINVGITFGSPEAVPGGKALPFYASYRVAMKKTGKVRKEAGHTTVRTNDGYKKQVVREVIGQNIVATLDKSKLNKPHRDVYFTFSLEDASVDEIAFAVTWALEHGIIDDGGRGKWTWGDWSGIGRRGLEALLAKDATAWHQIRNEVVASYSPGASEALSKKVLRPKLKSSSKGATASTQAAGRAASSTTAATKKTSAKSKKATKRTR